MSRDFGTLLVANRGEIAVRIFRTARIMGIGTVAVYSDADAGALHTKSADMAVRIGPAPAAESYLDIEAVIAAAKRSGAEAIHPGYGFLSESAEFARACEAAGLLFIGPPAEAIAAMGDKSRAKERMIEAGVPTIPGWQGEDQAMTRLTAEAAAIGFPLLVKAAAGGGGRGMREVHHTEELEDAVEAAKREAKAAFGDDKILLEKLIRRGRHIEIQILADDHGGAISLGERDCSAQRRRQKVVEEAPSPAVDEELRARMGADAVAAARAVGYRGAGTVEFLLGPDGNYHFLEMNTRLQVEHPVTEAVTGIDLVRVQIDIARGLPVCAALETREALSLRPGGHAIEARLYAEDPESGFAPQSGEVAYFDASEAGPGLRIDAGVETGATVTPYYDPMLAKFIAHGRDRAEAISRLCRLLEERVLLGVKTNGPLLAALLKGAPFRDGAVTTEDLDAWAAAETGPFAKEETPFGAFALCALILAAPRRGAMRSASVRHFSLTLSAGAETKTLTVRQDGPGAVTAMAGEDSLSLRLVSRDGAALVYEAEGTLRRAMAVLSAQTVHLAIGTRIYQLSESSPFTEERTDEAGTIRAPVTGTVIALHADEGRAVAKGERLGVMEAMKMEIPLIAGMAGTISAVHVTIGQQAASADLLIEIASDKEG